MAKPRPSTSLTTVLVIPVFKSLKISPVLGFLFSGLVLQQLGLFQDLAEIEKLSELGVLFLLFEMGLELSLDRLKALAKYAFGMGSLQILICVSIFTFFALPAGTGLGTQFLTTIAGSQLDLVSIRTVNEAIVIAAALSMSSSAFVLQLLSERGETSSKFGSATLGILLFQDIAVVPFLVLLPLITSGAGGELMAEAQSPMLLAEKLVPTLLQTVGGLGALFLADKLVLKRIFAMVAQSRNPETFVALCLLTVTGTSLLTQKLGFSDTLGAFLAGVLLSETNYRTQIEADIRPFKGLLLGLFFVSVGASVDTEVLIRNWKEVFWILAGLLVVKVSVITGLGRLFGLSRTESIKTGFMLSQGGEFAFVLLSLANQLQILPENLNQLLIIVVVLSMALTPSLADLGQSAADALDSYYAASDEAALLAASGGGLGPVGVSEVNGGGEPHRVSPTRPRLRPSHRLQRARPKALVSSASPSRRGDSLTSRRLTETYTLDTWSPFLLLPRTHPADQGISDPIVICGFSPAGQMVANMLESPLATSGSSQGQLGYVAFDLDPVRVAASRKAGFEVLFGDGTRAAVLKAAGVERPKAVVICYPDKEQALRAVHSIRSDFPGVRLYACASDLRHAAELEQAGADSVVIRSVEAGLALGGQVLQELGTAANEVQFLRKGIEDSVAKRAHALVSEVKKASAAGGSSLDILLTGAEYSVRMPDTSRTTVVWTEATAALTSDPDDAPPSSSPAFDSSPPTLASLMASSASSPLHLANSSGETSASDDDDPTTPLYFGRGGTMLIDRSSEPSGRGSRVPVVTVPVGSRDALLMSTMSMSVDDESDSYLVSHRFMLSGAEAAKDAARAAAVVQATALVVPSQLGDASPTDSEPDRAGSVLNGNGS
ncbi:MAG: hypothetical protein WDW36_010057 [Sanguina aurantia]